MVAQPDNGKQSVVILTITHKPQLSRYEEISIAQCTSVLEDYQKVFVCPKGMDITYYQTQFPSWSYHFVNSYWLSSYKKSNRLKVTPKLFNAFRSFRFILFYEPDAFVFKDELLEWCKKDYSYIGAPWLEGLENAKENAPYDGVGNSGLSLRKVSDHLKALRRYGILYYPNDYFNYIKNKSNKQLYTLKFIVRLLIGNTTLYPLSYFWSNEDRFWGVYVNRAFYWFKVPSVEIARQFSMEAQPARMYEENNHELPFGCHAWWRYDLEFWKPFIEQYGYKLDK